VIVQYHLDHHLHHQEVPDTDTDENTPHETTENTRKGEDRTLLPPAAMKAATDEREQRKTKSTKRAVKAKSVNGAMTRKSHQRRKDIRNLNQINLMILPRLMGMMIQT
jgi:hypothetical protein